MKPRLLIASDCFLPRKDGISRYLQTVIPTLQADFDITIIAPRYEGVWDRRAFADMEFVFFDLSGISVADFTLSKPDIRLLKEHIAKADLIWTHTLGPIGAATIFFAKQKHIVAQIHSRETELLTNSLKIRYTRLLMEAFSTRVVRYLYNKCALLIVPSEDTRSYITSLGITACMKTIHMGIDPKIYHPVQDKVAAKHALRIDPKTFVFGYTGRIAKEKDLQTLSKAFLLFQKKYPDSLLLIVGDGLAKEKVLLTHPAIRITGFVHNVVPF